ncbi:hypothetical protein HHI36_013824 [Cryptolaemus montrouzieri]|uniref:Uncharacterized protein n=1 Tax=Cryptolaemus montrouzieri TaxID=559131 RepID=A0ABD2N228_9CUCU
MTHTSGINGTVKVDSSSSSHVHAANGYIIENVMNLELENAVPFDVDQQKDYVYNMHNYCCNPEKLKKKCDENYHKLVLKRKELGSAKRKIKKLKSRVAFLKDVIKNLKQNGSDITCEHKSL